MTLRTGKILTVTLTFDSEKEEWGGSVVFEKDLMPMELKDALSALASLRGILTGHARQMISHAESNYARDEALDDDIASGRVKPS